MRRIADRRHPVRPHPDPVPCNHIVFSARTSHHNSAKRLSANKIPLAIVVTSQAISSQQVALAAIRDHYTLDTEELLRPGTVDTKIIARDYVVITTGDAQQGVLAAEEIAFRSVEGIRTVVRAYAVVMSPIANPQPGIPVQQP